MIHFRDQLGSNALSLYKEMINRFLVWAAITCLFLTSHSVAEELPDGISLKESVPISNPVMTQSSKDYFRDGIKFFSADTISVPGAPKDVRSYRFYNGGVKILTVDVEDQKSFYSGDNDYRIWAWKDSVTIFCLDDDFFVYVRFDKSSDPIFQSNADHEAMRKHYIENKAEYKLQIDP